MYLLPYISCFANLLMHYKHTLVQFTFAGIFQGSIVKPLKNVLQQSPEACVQQKPIYFFNIHKEDSICYQNLFDMYLKNNI